AHAFSWFSKSASPFAPFPDEDWYVDTTIRLIFPRSCSGLRATHSGIATQFGLATIPFLMWCNWSAFTSGTTSGQSGSIRQADELSTTIAPAFAATGLYSLLTELGVLDSTIWTPANASGRIGSTGYAFPANSTDLPALFSEARN